MPRLNDDLNDTDEVPVLVADLKLIERALSAAYGTATAWDLLNQYRELAGRPKKSALATALQNANGRVQGYLAEADPINQDDDELS